MTQTINKDEKLCLFKKLCFLNVGGSGGVSSDDIIKSTEKNTSSQERVRFLSHQIHHPRFHPLRIYIIVPVVPLHVL